MRKYTLFAFLGLSVIPPVEAGGFFVGIDLGKTRMILESDYLNLHDGNVSGSISPGLRIGFTDKNYRVYGVLGNQMYSKKEGDSTEQSISYWQLSAHIDFFFSVYDKLKIFAGPHIGRGLTHFKSNANEHSTSGAVYGGQLGILYDVSQNFNIEAGYNHSFTNIDKNLDRTLDDVNVEADVKIDQVSRFYLAANYVF